MDNAPVIWFPLDPEKADYGAKFGARVGDCTLLELSPTHCVIVGAMSCASRADAEYHARRNWQGPQDKDRRVTVATLNSWRVPA